jgi:hypothetical protein
MLVTMLAASLASLATERTALLVSLFMTLAPVALLK